MTLLYETDILKLYDVPQAKALLSVWKGSASLDVFARALVVHFEARNRLGYQRMIFNIQEIDSLAVEIKNWILQPERSWFSGSNLTSIAVVTSTLIHNQLSISQIAEKMIVNGMEVRFFLDQANAIAWTIQREAEDEQQRLSS